MTDPDGEVRRRLTLYAAYVSALERRTEVADAIWDAADADAAVRAVAALLDVDEECAHAVLNLQWKRLSTADRASIRDQHDELAALLDH